MKEQEREERRKLREEMGENGGKEVEELEEEEEEEPLPEIFMPPTPSPILCGFYSGPEKFWISLVSNTVIILTSDLFQHTL